jgi:hypothetical protein
MACEAENPFSRNVTGKYGENGKMTTQENGTNGTLTLLDALEGREKLKSLSLPQALCISNHNRKFAGNRSII